MTELLKKLIEEKINRKVTTRSDCELVSNVILETIDETISYSTIKRFYGLNAYANSNKKSLNILSRFVGYENYPHFIQNFNNRQNNNLLQLTYKTVSECDKNKIIKLIIDSKMNSLNFVEFIIVLIRELLHNDQFEIVNDIFNLNELNISSLSYTDALYLGNSIGLIFRKKNKSVSDLLKNINFLNCVYLTFVDYTYLNGYYGIWTKKINKQKVSNEILIFTAALLQLKKFLNKKTTDLVFSDLIFSKEINPILCSRLFSLYFLTETTTNLDKILNEYFEFHSKKYHLLDYSHELFTTAILTKNTFLMSFLIKKINIDENISYVYQKHHLNSYYLMSLFYFRFSLNKKEEISYFKLFKLENCTLGYEKFIEQLYLIYLFHSNKEILEKEKIREKYINLSKKTKYSIFTQDYLENYFI